jgi:hypothetical protein
MWQSYSNRTQFPYQKTNISNINWILPLNCLSGSTVRYVRVPINTSCFTDTFAAMAKKLFHPRKYLLQDCSSKYLQQNRRWQNPHIDGYTQKDIRDKITTATQSVNSKQQKHSREYYCKRLRWSWLNHEWTGRRIWRGALTITDNA